jgi:3-phenylpropionate/trans-cinnamate dioxygenase ferredoxin reductase subunit
MPEPIVDYLIIGGGVAGGHAIFEIRRHDRAGSIVVINREDHFPYDRPPLSKGYLAGEKEKSEVFFRADSFYRRNGINFIGGHAAVALDPHGRMVTLDDGRVLRYRSLLLATGGLPRKLGIPGSELEGIHYLRTIEDCEGVREAAARAKRVVVVGGGFIGCEVAATLRGKGLDVTLIHRARQLLNTAIDAETANWIRGYHEKKCVKVLLNANVAGFLGKAGRLEAVQLDGGKSVPADLAVVGIGIDLNVGLAKKANLKMDQGVLVNEYLETSASGIYAAGDIARFFSPAFNRRLRVEHVDVAQKQGTTAGKNMAGLREPFGEYPYFFSNQFDIEINAYGDLSRHSQVVRRGKLGADPGFIQFYFDGKKLGGILSVNVDWKEIEWAKKLLEAGKEFIDPQALADESKTLRQHYNLVRRAWKPQL